MLLQKIIDQGAVSDGAQNEVVPRVILNVIQGVEVACIGEGIQINDFGLFTAHLPKDKVTADETSAAGDKDCGVG